MSTVSVVFDELIQNRDRNQGNTLYTKDWAVWMIDHTRAFRLNKDVGKPEELIRVERTLYENLKKLTAASLAAAVGKQLRKAEQEALMARRRRHHQVLRRPYRQGRRRRGVVHVPVEEGVRS